MTAHRKLHAILPAGVDDPATPSGGNVYDRRVCDGLRAAGWSVEEVEVPGSWPQPGPRALDRLARCLNAVPDGGLVLIDGLVACANPEVLVPAGRRLRLATLLHLPLGVACEDETVRRREEAVLSSCAATLTSSRWTRDWLARTYGIDPAKVHVAAPGTDRAELASGSPYGGELLCVAALTPEKGHDILLEALSEIVDLGWRCSCVGPRREPRFAADLRRRAEQAGLGDRLGFPGPRTARALCAAYAAADLLVLPSRLETYGMVVGEALARGIPVIASEVGGVPEALGSTRHGRRPGLLVPAGDAPALAAALRRWLEDDGWRTTLRRAARERRASLPGWDQTTDRVARVLEAVAA
ncbi:glycosyltransferase family 4 protein [Pedococcus sp. 5OH_020]|uniref:glycosyltransferase family 4 protein n=1 Tax=Pedococcus sp. 5OH_020 TaxID=2989814 RepID=UPI0022E99826|nr:glycosyltransferase family 4 protein [Pedococcus sp. 5OH_020]